MDQNLFFTSKPIDRLFGEKNFSFFWDCLQELLPFLETFPLGKIESPIPNGVYLTHPESIFIGKNCSIEPGAFIKGPSVIEEGSSIRHGAYVREGSYIGPRSIIGHGTEIKHSVLIQEAQAAHFSYIGDSILGKGAHLGAGVICANVRLDKKEVCYREGSQKISTKRKKFGAVLGDFVKIGCNSVINPGAFIEKGKIFPPLSSIKGGTFHSVAKTEKTHESN